MAAEPVELHKLKVPVGAERGRDHGGGTAGTAETEPGNRDSARGQRGNEGWD